MRKILYILGHLSEHDVDWLISAGHRETLKKGQVLIHQGSHAPAIYIILDGELDVFGGNDEHGTRLACLFAGDLVGEMSFVDASPTSATVIAMQDTTLFAVPNEVLAEKLNQDMAFARNFYRAIAIFLSDRLRAANRQATATNLDSEGLDDDELDSNVLDNAFLAGTRFDRMMQRMMSL